MPTSTLPESKEKAHEMARQIANERPLRRDREAPEGQVSGGFNQKRDPQVADRSQANRDISRALDQPTSASRGDGQ